MDNIKDDRYYLNRGKTETGDCPEDNEINKKNRTDISLVSTVLLIKASG